MKKPIVLVIMDGVGRGDGGPGDAVKQANTPTLDKLMATCPMTWLKAHGTAVGLPTDDDMGNSEVGHNALGCGQIYSQGAKLVQESIETGSLYQSKTWVELTDNCLQNGKALHFIGLLSDGNVHSNISHLIAMLKKARADGPQEASTATSCSTAVMSPRRARWSMSTSSRPCWPPCPTRSTNTRSRPAAAVWSSPWTGMRPTGRWSKRAGAHTCRARAVSLPPPRKPSRPTAPRTPA